MDLPDRRNPVTTLIISLSLYDSSLSRYSCLIIRLFILQRYNNYQNLQNLQVLIIVVSLIDKIYFGFFIIIECFSTPCSILMQKNIVLNSPSFGGGRGWLLAVLSSSLPTTPPCGHPSKGGEFAPDFSFLFRTQNYKKFWQCLKLTELYYLCSKKMVPTKEIHCPYCHGNNLQKNGKSIMANSVGIAMYAKNTFKESIVIIPINKVLKKRS